MEKFSRNEFTSRRSDVLGLNGIVATSNPIAANAGLDILKKGGNCVDAAVCAASVLNVVEPMSTGIGGDVFALIYDKNTSSVKALNGSGRSGRDSMIEDFSRLGFQEIPTEGQFSGMSVSVPGAVDAWQELLDKFGNFSLDSILLPAIDIANRGFGVSEITANLWLLSEGKLSINNNCDFLINNKSPKFGDLFSNPNLANTLKGISENGKSYFYQGEIPNKISDYVKRFHGWLSEEDFTEHESEWVEPITTNYRGYDVWECPPNGQGIAALIALNIFENFDKFDSESDKLHYQIESMKIAFEDALWYIADPSKVKVPVEQLLSKEYAKERFKEIDNSRSNYEYKRGNFKQQGDTVYISVIDGDGNACSLINSLYQGFGTGLVVPETGIALQNRGALFSLNSDHPNIFEPLKRPFNTIIPAMITQHDQLVSSMGVMGGFQQAQGHLQVISNMVDYGMSPQSALDSNRFSVSIEEDLVYLEDSFPDQVISELKNKVHNIDLKDGYERGLFGGGQIINKYKNGILIGGSDPRKDGQAVSY
ncbi:MAG: gamma-glutamyltransferase [Chloroflexota bacterium]|nr:gamma-glutamyltransferase [Chloroflexota bacterium]